MTTGRFWCAILIAVGMAGMAMGQVADGVAEDPTSDPLGAAITLPTSAVSNATAEPIYDLQLVNPTSAGTLDLLLDQVTLTLADGTGAPFAGPGILAGVRIEISGSSNPVFTGNDNSINSTDDPLLVTTVSATQIIFGPNTDDDDGIGDLLTIADGDTVVITVYAWSPGGYEDADDFTIVATAVTDLSVDDSGGTLDTIANVGFPVQTTTVASQADLLIVSSATLTPAGLDSSVTVPSTATSKLVAVPVFEFLLTDTDDALAGGANLRPTWIDGLTIPVTLSGGLDPSDIAGVSLEIVSSTPLNTTVFGAAVGGDREINTADDPDFIKMDSTLTGIDFAIKVGVNAGPDGSEVSVLPALTGLNDGVGDLLALLDPGLVATPVANETATLRLSIWLNSSGVTNNSTATFDLTAENVTMDQAGTGSDIVSSSLDVTNGVASIIVVTNAASNLADAATVPNSVILSSSAVDINTPVDVFDFTITDGIGGSSTKIDSISIPVTLSGGAQHSDILGAKLSIDNGAGIVFSGGNTASINLRHNPTLVSIDSVDATTLHLNFIGQSTDNTDAVADLLEIPDGGLDVTFTVAVWLDTSDISYGASYTFDLQNDDLTLTSDTSDGIAAGQDVTDGVATAAVARISDVSTIAEGVALSSAAVENTTTPMTTDADNAVAVFDFQIIDPADGVPLLIDGLRIPLSFADGADFADVLGAELTVTGLTTNEWLAGSGIATIFEGIAGANVTLTDPDILVGALSGAGTRNDGIVDALTIADGETATVTVSLWLSAASLVDSSSVTLNLDRTGIVYDTGVVPGTNPTSVVGADQSASGSAYVRAATVSDVDSVPAATFLSHANAAGSEVTVFGFSIADPSDGFALKIDSITLTAAGTGGTADIVDVLFAITGTGVTINAADAGATVGTLQADDADWADSGTFPATGQTITIGGGGAGADGVGDLIEVADGDTATFIVSVNNAGGIGAGGAVTFDLSVGDIVVDAGITPANTGTAVSGDYDLTDKIVTMTAATTLLADRATVGDATSVSSLANAVGTAVAVFDFTVTDLAGGAVTSFDELTIPITFNDVDFADVSGVSVAFTNGASTYGVSDSDDDGALTSGVDAGISLANVTGGMEIRLGGASTGVTTVANSAPELAVVADGTSGDITVSIFLSSGTAVLIDGGTLTLSLSSDDFVVDPGLSDAFVGAQSVTAGVATIDVVATELTFATPSTDTLAVDGVSEELTVAATDANGNTDVDFAGTISVDDGQATSGQFGATSSAFDVVANPITGNVLGELALYYKSDVVTTETLTASATGLTDGTLSLIVEAFSVLISWTNPAVGDTTATDSAGTFFELGFSVDSNDPNLLLEFWADTSPTLSEVDPQTATALTIYNPQPASVLGNLRNPSGATFGPGTEKAAATDVAVTETSQNVYVSNLDTGGWYIYVTRGTGNGASAGGDTLGRSGRLEVTHFPTITALGLTVDTDGDIDAGPVFSLNSADAVTSINVLFYGQDDDSNDDVLLYISTKDDLTAATVLTDTASFAVASSSGWKTDDVGDTYRFASVDISDSLGTSGFHAAGTYYVYALVTDSLSSVTAFAEATSLTGDQQSIFVNHSPSFAFSYPEVGTPITDHDILTNPSITLAWNEGDEDIDDNATISLWFADAAFTPTAFTDTLSSGGNLTRIVSGLKEDSDERVDDQYNWDLTLFDGELPVAGSAIKVWALLDDGSIIPVFEDSEEITFAAYTEVVRLLNPPPGAPTEIRENETFRFFFDAAYAGDVATNATVRYLISSDDGVTAPSGFTFDTGGASTFPTNYNAFWVSDAGELQEGLTSVFDWTPDSDGNSYVTEISPLTIANSTFYVYAIMRSTEADITEADADFANLTMDQAPGRIKVKGIGTNVQAPGAAASPNQAQVVVGDTLRVFLVSNTNNTDVQGYQLYINVDSTEFVIVDQDATTSGIQPFGFDTSYFFGSVTAQKNEANLDGTTYKLDLDVHDLSSPDDPTGETLAHIDLVTKSFSGAAEVLWNLDSVNDPDRIPVYYNASGLLSVPFSNPLVTIPAISRGTISGFVPLEGQFRTTDSKVTTFWLRLPGSWIAISDTTFANANDTDTATDAVQVTTGADGSFTLTDVPAGSYELVAKSESYLAGFTTVEIVNAQAVTGLEPTDLDASAPGQLLGGDLDNDNKINTEDESAMNLAFDTALGETGFSSAADIDDDDVVGLSDLLILGANLSANAITGVAPVYKSTPGINAGAAVELVDVPLDVVAGEEFTVMVQLQDITMLQGYSMNLVYDSMSLEVVDLVSPLLQDRPAVRVLRPGARGEYVLAEALKSHESIPIGQSLLAEVSFRALRAIEAPQIAVENAYIADAGSIVELAARVTRAIPQQFLLRQNMPNPFNPSTHISFDVAMDGVPVTLTIYNITGQPIRHLMRAESVKAGRYTLSWNGLDDQGHRVGSGMYLYNLSAGSYTESKKMLMMK